MGEEHPHDLTTIPGFQIRQYDGAGADLELLVHLIEVYDVHGCPFHRNVEREKSIIVHLLASAGTHRR